MNIAKKLQVWAWMLTALVAGLAVIAWGEGNRWKFGDLSSYNLFPLLGLLAFSIMWAHYIVAAVRIYLNVEKQSTASYFRTTSYIVLAFILLHPGLLIWQLWRDGFGLPPDSYLRNYVAANAAWAAMFGSVSLFIFLAYEFHRKFGEKPWWKYVQYSSDAAMVLIFVHALKLGRQLSPGWFRVVWWVYGVGLLGVLVYTYIIRKSKAKGVDV